MVFLKYYLNFNVLILINDLIIENRIYIKETLQFNNLFLYIDMFNTFNTKCFKFLLEVGYYKRFLIKI